MMVTPATTPVISQRSYPGAGDIDDCWVVASVWAAVASRPGIRQPTVTEYRRHAGDPDDGIRDGGSLDEVIAGARGSWPDLPVVRYQSTDWTSFASAVRANRPASLAVDSATLPSVHRYGFLGKHQVGVAWDAPRKTFVLANPLAADGSAPKPITEASLRTATMALIPQLREVRAAIFPAPLPDTSTGDAVSYKIVDTLPTGRLSLRDQDGIAYLRLRDGKVVEVTDPVAFGTKEPVLPVRLDEPMVAGKPATDDWRLGYIVGEDAAFVLARNVIISGPKYTGKVQP